MIGRSIDKSQWEHAMSCSGWFVSIARYLRLASVGEDFLIFWDILKFSGMWSMWSGPELILQIWTLETRWVYTSLWVNWRWWSSYWESCSFKHLQPPHATRQTKCSRFSSKVDLLCLSNGFHCFSLFFIVPLDLFHVFLSVSDQSWLPVTDGSGYY